MDALRMTGVRLGYPGRPRVLDGVSLAVKTGSLLVVEGRSGSGKSSLLAVAAGLQTPSEGSVHVRGEALDPHDAAQRAAVRSRHVGLVFQHLHLLGELTLQQNVELPMTLARAPRSQASARARELLHAFDLGALARRRPAQVSGGEQQRVAIARALAMRPALLLVDEPTSNLDDDNARTVVGALQAAAASGAGVLVASHDELMRKAGPRVILVRGRLESPA